MKPKPRPDELSKSVEDNDTVEFLEQAKEYLETAFDRLEDARSYLGDINQDNLRRYLDTAYDDIHDAIKEIDKRIEKVNDLEDDPKDEN